MLTSVFERKLLTFLSYSENLSTITNSKGVVCVCVCAWACVCVCVCQCVCVCVSVCA